MQTNPSNLFVGIDVSKDHLDVAFSNADQVQRVVNQEKSLQKFVKKLSTLTPTLVLLEATGGLERALTHALAAEKIPFRIINPRQIHRPISQNRCDRRPHLGPICPKGSA